MYDLSLGYKGYLVSQCYDSVYDVQSIKKQDNIVLVITGRPKDQSRDSHDDTGNIEVIKPVIK